MRRNLTAASLSAIALLLSACGGGGGGDDTGAAGDTGDGAGGSGTVSVTGTDDLKWSETELSAAAGTVTVELECGDSVPHTFVVEEAGDTLVAECEGGGSGTGTIDLEAGTYTYYCDIPGHRPAGMEGTLQVG